MFNIGNKINTLTFRFTNEEIIKIKDGAGKEGLDVSKFARNKILNENIKVTDGKYDKKALAMARKEKTEKHYNLFHIANTLQTIIKMSKNSFVVSKGDFINMEAVSEVIDEAVKVYNHFPKKDKKILKHDMENLKKFRDKKYLREVLLVNKSFEDKSKDPFKVVDMSTMREKTKIEYAKDIGVKLKDVKP